MIFRGENPPSGAILDFWLSSEESEARLSILDGDGEEIAGVPVRNQVGGVNRVLWNLRHRAPGQGEEETPRGPLVVPGSYTVRLTVDGQSFETPLEVREDPRIQVTQEVRAQWTADLMALAELGFRATERTREMSALVDEIGEAGDLPHQVVEEGQDLMREWRELSTRIRRLNGEVEGWVGPPTGQQQSQWSFYREMVETLSAEMEALRARVGG
jgi:hypothetical protein